MRRFILVIFGLLFLANLATWFALGYVLVRLNAPSPCRWSLGIFLLLQVAGLAAMIGVRLFGYQPGTGLGRPLLCLIMIWNLLLVLPTAIITVVWALFYWLTQPSSPDEFWQQIGLAAVGLPFAITLLASSVALWQINHFRLQKITLSIPQLPSALKGFTIVHLSDLHLGKLTRGKVLVDIVAATNQLNPDVILFTGDLINMSLEDLPQAIEILHRLKARYGLFLCEGNHDLIENRLKFESTMKASGCALLLNESAAFKVEGHLVQIIGLCWDEEMARGREDVGQVSESALDRLLAQRQPDDFTLLLTHHPDAFEAAAQAGIPLTFAGHTHGGQLMFSQTIGFGPWFYRYWSGLYQKGNSRLIVSNGVGNWFPLRIHAPAEIIQVTLE